MAKQKLTLVISQSPGRNPAKRALEEAIAAEFLFDPEIEVSLVPHLYDLHEGHSGLLFLRSLPGDLLVLSWLFPRATHWLLDRQGVRGRQGSSLLHDRNEDEQDAEDLAEAEAEDAAGDDSSRNGGIGPQGVLPPRTITSVDLRSSEDPAEFIAEIRRIAREASVQTVDLTSFLTNEAPGKDLTRYLQRQPNGDPEPAGSPSPTANGNGQHRTPLFVDEEEPSTAVAFEPTKRRWYPVIDYSRCTNCLECIDFCLFGVYGIDERDVILVEQQDNCKKGCPACSRVCPANAIIFAQHKTPAIAGADGEVENLKIDLSKLFGAPDKDPLELAVAERDVELVRDGRDAVGEAVGIKRRRPERKRDDLDELFDQLDALKL